MKPLVTAHLSRQKKFIFAREFPFNDLRGFCAIKWK